MTDRFTRLLGIQQPIIQAPMLGVSTPALAAAVSNAGGLGSIAITGSAAEKGRALIREVRGLTDKPFNVNLFCHRPGQADPARERLAGLPEAAVRRVRRRAAGAAEEHLPEFPRRPDPAADAAGRAAGGGQLPFRRAAPRPGSRVAGGGHPRTGLCHHAGGSSPGGGRRRRCGGRPGHRGRWPSRGVRAGARRRRHRHPGAGPPAGGARFATGGGCRRDHGRTGHPRRPGAGRERRADGHRLRPLSGVLGQRRLPRGAEGAARGTA